MQIINLASGSKANSTFVEFENTKILIDVGLTEKQLRQALTKIDRRLEDITAVCITHEHIDHIRALKSLALKTDIDFYIKKELAESSFLSDYTFKEGKLHKIEIAKFSVGELEITPFEISHDAISPIGFVVNVYKSRSRAGFVTDLGIVTNTVKQNLVNTKIVFLESNYDEDMLINGTYPYIVKERINSNKGHLSNSQSLELAKYLYDNGTRCFVLSHLSQNNNTPEIAYSNFATYFENKGLVLDKDVFLRLSFQERHGNKFIIKEEFYE